MNKLDKTLAKLGFHATSSSEYSDLKGDKKIVLKGDGIYAYSIDRGFVEDSDYLEMHLNFIPDDMKVLTYLIKRIFYI
jgi:hypothetical protein